LLQPVLSRIPAERHKVWLMRQALTPLYDPQPGVSVSTLSYDFAAGHDVGEHAHGADQLLFGTSGVMHVAARRRLWLIPPQFAVWIPAGSMHSIHMHASVSMRTLYLRPCLAFGRRSTCKVMLVTPLLKELILETTRLGALRDGVAKHRKVRDLLICELRDSQQLMACITLPREARALAVARIAMEGDASELSLPELCRYVGASVRTIERAFIRDLGVTFDTWRRQVRLVKGMELLASGHSVKETAYRVGYRGASAFVEMFRRSMSTTPAQWARTVGRAT
jgi:AraC-like DNA-binding protein/quercetin dioxygenase-like cupin family protein